MKCLSKSRTNGFESYEANQVISFIIIGRNEGWKLGKCFTSVFNTIDYNKLTNFEVIYVDSNSTDDSIAQANKFNNVRTFKITGKYNAAIARNIGAKEAVGDVFFFIDGDMQICADFLPLVYDEKQGLFDDFVSGNFININYDNDWNFIDKEDYLKLRQDKLQFTTGGLFLIKSKIWYQLGGMKNKLRRNQDVDFALRLARMGILLNRKKEIIAYHHTIPYTNFLRSWQMIFNGSESYRAVLLRDNFFNKYQWVLFIRENYTCITFVVCIMIFFFLKVHSIFLIYFSLIMMRSYFKSQKSIPLTLRFTIYFLFRDLITFISLFLFWPTSSKKMLFVKA